MENSNTPAQSGQDGDHAMVVQQIPLVEISLGEGTPRHTNENQVASLAKSIDTVGIIHPIGVRPGGEIVYGCNRVWACKRLGWETIPAVIVDTDDLRAELAQIDENLQRKQLTKLEESKALARRKEIFEALHPETKQGGAKPKRDGKGGKAKKGKNDKMSSLPSFSDDTAAATGKSKRTIQRDVATANAIPTDVQETIAGLAVANNKSELTKLGKLPEAEQREVARMLAAGEITSVPAESEPERFCPECDGALGHCGCGQDEGHDDADDHGGDVGGDVGGDEGVDHGGDAAEDHAKQTPAVDKPHGSGLRHAADAINALKRIMPDDCFRERGYEKVGDFVLQNSQFQVDRKRNRDGRDILDCVLKDVRSLIRRIEKSEKGMAVQRKRAVDLLQSCRTRVREGCKFLT